MNDLPDPNSVPFSEGGNQSCPGCGISSGLYYKRFEEVNGSFVSMRYCQKCFMKTIDKKNNESGLMKHKHKVRADFARQSLFDQVKRGTKLINKANSIKALPSSVCDLAFLCGQALGESMSFDAKDENEKDYYAFSNTAFKYANDIKEKIEKIVGNRKGIV